MRAYLDDLQLFAKHTIILVHLFRWLWWQLWLGVKPKLRAGNFEQFKQDLAKKTVFAANHLDDVIKEREVAEAKNKELVKEFDDLKHSMSGGANAKQVIL